MKMTKDYLNEDITNNKNTKYDWNFDNDTNKKKKNLISCGIIMYRILNDKYYYLCVHPGGPYFKNKDKNCWSIPKGVVENNESFFFFFVKFKYIITINRNIKCTIILYIIIII